MGDGERWRQWQQWSAGEWWAKESDERRPPWRQWPRQDGGARWATGHAYGLPPCPEPPPASTGADNAQPAKSIRQQNRAELMIKENKDFAQDFSKAQTAANKRRADELAGAAVARSKAARSNPPKAAAASSASSWRAAASVPFPEPEHHDDDGFNPLLRAIHGAVNKSSESLQYGTLKKVMGFNVAKHVATYVIDEQDGTMLLFRAPGKKERPKYQTFGGCDHPSNIIHRINSMRLELMDEMAFIPPPTATFSPLVLQGAALLQVVLVNGIDEKKKCWSPERCRSHLQHVYFADPENVTDADRESVKAKQNGSFERVALTELENIPWRDCDGHSYRVLARFITHLLAGAWDSRKTNQGCPPPRGREGGGGGG